MQFQIQCVNFVMKILIIIYYDFPSIQCSRKKHKRRTFAVRMQWFYCWYLFPILFFYDIEGSLAWSIPKSLYTDTLLRLFTHGKMILICIYLQCDTKVTKKTIQLFEKINKQLSVCNFTDKHNGKIYP